MNILAKDRHGNVTTRTSLLVWNGEWRESASPLPRRSLITQLILSPIHNIKNLTNVHANNNFEMKNSTHTGTSNEHSKRLLKGANMEYKVQVDITK
jgi:hypothetical protein